MRSLNPSVYAALQERRLVARDFIIIRARDRSNPLLKIEQGFWSDVQNITAEIRDPQTNSVVTKTFVGSGTMISVSAIPAVSNLTVQTVTVIMSQLDPAVRTAAYVYDLKQGDIEIYRGIFNPDSYQLVDAAICRFFGFINDCDIQTPAENDEGSIVLTCTSHTQEITRSNPATRSDEDQRKRLASDDFFVDAAVIGERKVFWGKENDTLKTAAGSRPQPTQRLS